MGAHANLFLLLDTGSILNNTPDKMTKFRVLQLVLLLVLVAPANIALIVRIVVVFCCCFLVVVFFFLVLIMSPFYILIYMF